MLSMTSFYTKLTKIDQNPNKIPWKDKPIRSIYIPWNDKRQLLIYFLPLGCGYHSKTRQKESLSLPNQSKMENISKVNQSTTESRHSAESVSKYFGAQSNFDFKAVSSNL